MRAEGGSQVMQYTGGQPISTYSTQGRRKGEAEEEWVTTKKVEITTTKNVEKKIQRQIVLEDGRVLEEEIPTVTNDTTEDKQTFETDHDEDRKIEAGSGLDLIQSKFHSKGGLLVGDKFTSVKKIQDIKENVVKTEAVQDMGDIRSKDVARVLKEKEDLRKYLRPKETTALVVPRMVQNKRNHRVITDQEDVQERNWLNDGKMQNERIKTEKHIEYDSDDTPDSGSSSSKSELSRHSLEPEIYKTRKDENFIEYFKIDRSNGTEKLVKVGDGAHYVSESKEVDLEEERLLQSATRSPKITHVTAQTERRPKIPVTHTDSWLERHFGSSSSSLSSSSVDLSRGGGGSGLRRSASICDIRPVTETSNVYYATVRKTGKVPVPRREKKDDYYLENRRSAHFTSSGHPVPPPRRKKNTDSDSSQYMSRENNIYESTSGTLRREKKPEYIYGTLKKSDQGNTFVFSREDNDEVENNKNSVNRHHYSSSQNIESSRQYTRKLDESQRRVEIENEKNRQSRSEEQKRRTKQGETNTDKYYFGRPLTTSSRQQFHHSSNSRSYSPAPQKIARSSKIHHQSTGNIYSQSRTYGSQTHHQGSGSIQPVIRSSKSHHQSTGNIHNPSMERKSHHQSTGNIYSSQTLEKSSKVLRGSTSDIYRVPQTAKYTRSRDIYESTPKTISRESDRSTNYNQGEIYRTTQREAYSSSKPKEIYATPVSKEVYATPISKQIYATPHSNDIYGTPASRELFSRRQQSHRIVYSTESPTGSPSTKYRTKIVLNGGLD